MRWFDCITDSMTRIGANSGRQWRTWELGASLVAQMVKNAREMMQETWVQSLDWEDPLEEIMATHSRIPAWRIPTDRGAWGATVLRVAKSQTPNN